MRTLIDIGEDSIRALDLLATRRKRSRAALVREAISDYLRRNMVDDPEDAFGLWENPGTDGLAYQEKLRNEW